MCKCRYRGCLLLLGLMWLCFSGSANSLMGAESTKKHSNKDTKNNKFFKEKAEIRKGINSGFYFLDGQYIDAPYFVTRDKNKIFINNILVAKYGPFRKRDYSYPGPLPKNLTRTSSLDDLNAHHYKMMSYYTNKLGPIKAKAKMFAYYKSLPFVKEVKAIYSESGGKQTLKNAATLQFTTYSGEKINVALGRQLVKIITEQEHYEGLEGIKQDIEKDLKEGTCFLDTLRGGEITIFKRDVLESLPWILKVIRSNLTLKEKKVVLSTGEHPLFPFSEIEGFDKLITNFKASKQLGGFNFQVPPWAPS